MGNEVVRLELARAIAAQYRETVIARSREQQKQGT
jgi:hypothetical protein